MEIKKAPLLGEPRERGKGRLSVIEAFYVYRNFVSANL